MKKRWINFACACVFSLLPMTLIYAAENEKPKTYRDAPDEPFAPGSVLREEFTPGSWTLAVLPDIQHQSQYCPGLSLAQTAWLVLNKERFNIAYALYLGDLTNHNVPAEWENVKAAVSLLNGKLPYALVQGNHDCGKNGRAATRDSLINEYFPVKTYRDWPTFGGVMEEGHIENSFHLFDAGGRKWIVIALEWAPRDETAAWANEVMQKHPDRLGILITHAYLYYDSQRYDHTAAEQTWNPHTYKTPLSINDGQELWDKLIRKNNFAFVINGHVLKNGTGYRADKNDAGKTVHQILCNYQMRDLGGEAYMRLMEFLPDGKTVKVRSYSPLWDRLLTQEDQQFTITLDD
ncbi:MAG: metallophosphoesterase [Sedimentisphaerales bacterium]|nr:metallophosphoesterase [Sedimentisphaerales bacterium]